MIEVVMEFVHHASINEGASLFICIQLGYIGAVQTIHMTVNAFHKVPVVKKGVVAVVQKVSPRHRNRIEVVVDHIESEYKDFGAHI